MEGNLNQFEIVFSNEKVHKIISDFIQKQYGFEIINPPRIDIDHSVRRDTIYGGNNDDSFIVRVLVENPFGKQFYENQEPNNP